MLFHMGDDRYDFSSPKRLTNLLKKAPDLKVIAAHFGGWAIWEQSFHHPQPENVLYDTSSTIPLVSEELVYRMFDRFGPERFLFGSDFPMWKPKDAVEQVLVGKEKKDRIMSAEERKIVSYHEVGHALISALQKNSEPVQKITIVPRTMGALGYVMHVPEEEKYLQTKAELHDRLVSLLGGRAAEELIFGNVTTGAANDIEQATNIATNMVTRFGMSDRFGLMGLATVESEYLGGGARLTCSDRTAADVDSEIMETLKQCYEEAKELLSGNRELMDKLAAHLIEKETISGKEFMKTYRAERGCQSRKKQKNLMRRRRSPPKG